MATPLGHALAGYVISQCTQVASSPIREDVERGNVPPSLLRYLADTLNAQQASIGRWTVMLLCVFMSLAPDLDLIPGMVQGQPILYHGGISHSLGMAMVASVLAAWGATLLGVPWRTAFVLSCIGDTRYVSGCFPTEFFRLVAASAGEDRSYSQN